MPATALNTMRVGNVMGVEAEAEDDLVKISALLVVVMAEDDGEETAVAVMVANGRSLEDEGGSEVLELFIIILCDYSLFGLPTLTRVECQEEK